MIHVHSRWTVHVSSIREASPLVTKAPREGASFITSQSELGVIGGGGADWWVFSAIPSGAGAKAVGFGPDFGPFG